ncbi:MAG: hypothetical protein OXQ32_08715 [bacterium]|nr:hypothetical protein [bacterium]MDE2875388.1 hypothetical protein [Gemmatimonadota bacterium]
MKKFGSLVWTRIGAVMLLAAFALPLAAADDDCGKKCNRLLVQVAIATGNGNTAAIVYDQCIENCPK